MDQEKNNTQVVYKAVNTGVNTAIKTIVLRIQNIDERERLYDIFSYDDYRVLIADNLLMLIEYLNNYRIDLLISDAEWSDIAPDDLLSYLRNKYFDIKIIITTREYSPELELRLRPYKLLYIMSCPVNVELLQSIVARGLEAEKTAFVYAGAY
jgi:DNA-binding NtrC family response regulator